MFAKSPFKPLVSHIDKVSECVNQIKPLFDAFLSSDYEKVESIAKEISKVEYKAVPNKYGKWEIHMKNPVDKEFKLPDSGTLWTNSGKYYLLNHQSRQIL